MNISAKAVLLTSAIALISSPALAQSKGDWTLGIGYATIDPKSDNGEVAGFDIDVDSDESFTFTAEYFFWDNVGVELLAAIPFEHDFDLGDDIDGSVEHLPPTLSINYHFPTNSPWKPYVGAGINYTTFSDEDISIDGDLELDDSWGIALQAGIDYQVASNGAIRFNVRWFDIDADAELDGEDIGTVEIDPFLFGIAYVFQF